MRQENSQQSQDNFKVAPLISDEKLSELKTKILSTILGISTLGHYEYNDLDPDIITKTKAFSLMMYFVVPLLIVIPSSVIVQWKFHPIAVLVSTIINPILSFLIDLNLNKPKHIHKYLVTAVFSYLWSVHFFISRQLVSSQLITSSTYSAIIILSLIALLTSSSTISFSPVRQFSASTFDYQQFNVHSTLYVRFYVLFPILVTQMGLYYSTDTGIWFEGLVGVQFGVAIGFVLWIFGWISSLYNTMMFFINNIINCLVFGEPLSHSGNNYRGVHHWWVSFIILALNIASIGFNILLLSIMKIRNKSQDYIVQSQHILLICCAYFTSLITTLIVYISYRCSKNKNNLLKFNKYNFTQSQKIKCFFGHKQLLMIFISILLPITLCLLSVFVFGEYYDAYSGGMEYKKQTNFIAEKITTYILLAVDVFCYLGFVGFKELTRVRSKIGCSINPLCFKQYFAQIQRDLMEKFTLKITGGLAIMALTLRVQNVQVFSYYILGITPISKFPHPYIYFFISSILFPILVYRSYKRSQNFSHFFHITIIVAMVLTVIDSTQYFYYSIFVVLAFPNFPQNAFRLLFISPFTTPKKLVHKNQCLYIVGFLAVNIITLILYVVTLGTMQFTSIMGLPMYWCIIPSINCQSSSKKQISTPIQKVKLKHSMSEFQMTQQVLKPLQQISKSTPQHNLYQKIVSEIPFYIFRNKKPGYYLLRISKYIILVQVVMDFYGLFETVSLIGLQTQQVTTCHAKQGQTIDHIIEHTWGDNPQNIKKCQTQDVIKTVIHEQHCISDSEFTSQNQIQLTGIIQSGQFYQLFKKCLIKSIIFNYNKMLKKNVNNQLNRQQIKDAQVLLDDLQNRMSKDRIDQFFPYSFINQDKNRFVFKARYNQLSPSKIIIKKKLPPIKKNDKSKKSDILAEFADLLQQNNTSNSIKPNLVEQSKGQKIDIDKSDDQNLVKSPLQDKKQASDLHMAVIVSAYLSVLGKINYLNTQKLYKMMKKDSSVISQFQFQGGLDLIANSVGCALKIAIGKQLQAEQQANYNDFVEYNKNEFFGTLQSAGFSQAIELSKSDIWTAAYNQTKKMLMVKRLAKNKSPLYMFSFENHAVQAVWNNLRFQLLFATNDNDQRYSIQTHQYLLRNLLVQGCQQPYGYAGYYSQQFLNL